ncbi:MAG: hypothetical protein NWQ24_12050 [Haliea sp.]|nr:hypothetical protein [Haliea sp.]
MKASRLKKRHAALCAAAALQLGWACLAAAQLPLPADAVRLTTSEIVAAFSNVRDEGQVQDGRGGGAVNYWFVDGRFRSEWRTKTGSGTVTGHWRAAADSRCVVIASGLPEREGVEECTPIYRQGEAYMSVNSAGFVHGLHTLSPINTAADNRP